MELGPDDPLFERPPAPIRRSKPDEEIIGRCRAPINPAWLFHPKWRHTFAPVPRLYLYLWVASHQGRLAVRLTNEAVTDLGIDRYCKYRCLRELEADGLIHVVRQGQKAPVVTVVV